MQLQIHEGTATSQVDGQTCQAHVAMCAVCQGLEFLVMWIDEDTEAHMECAACHAMYCVGHECKG